MRGGGDTVCPAGGSAASASACPVSHGAPSSSASASAKHDDDHGQTEDRWVYPSEAMFFAALRRKGTAAGADARPADMKRVVPLHNAVNERVWAEIVAWERAWGAADPAR